MINGLKFDQLSDDHAGNVGVNEKHIYLKKTGSTNILSMAKRPRHVV